MRGLRKYLTPFAPDQSGAVSALFELGGLIVICDAGGCTGNVCGFDEPRWTNTRSAVFSAGLRDMDAILGRDDKLADELADAARKIDAEFAAIIGTPVPAVIATDYRALGRLSERRSGLATITVDTAGCDLYDVGASKAYRALFDRFATDAFEPVPGAVGIIGANPLDLEAISADAILAAYPGALCYGMGAGMDDVRRASRAEKNLVLSPSGLAAAKLLEKRFGTPYEPWWPTALAGAAFRDADVEGKRVLVVNQQVAAHAMRDDLLARGAELVDCASWFMLERDLASAEDTHLREEDDLAELVRGGSYDMLVGDPVLWRIVDGCGCATVDVPQFSVSGKLGDEA